MGDTRTKILDVAEGLVQSVGLNAMSYQDISTAVGIRKASIHHHFPKKEDLVNELIARCRSSYGKRYQAIVEGELSSPEKLRQLGEVFQKGLEERKLCLVGSMSTDRNTLQERSCHMLKETIRNTVDIFAKVFSQGRGDGSLKFSGTEEETAYAFFSFLVGAQVVARTSGGCEWFKKATEVLITSWTA